MKPVRTVSAVRGAAVADDLDVSSKNSPAPLRLRRGSFRGDREWRNRVIVALWRAGLPRDAIGELVGCSGQHANRIALAFGEAARGDPVKKSFWMCRRKYSELSKSARLIKIFLRAEAIAALVAEGRTRDEVCRAAHIRRADLELVAVYAGFEVPGGDCDGVDAPEQVKSRSCVSCSVRFQAQRFRFRCDNCLQNADGETEYLGELPA